MRHHPASLPFFSACINGANRNYQTLHYSLKPSYGNCHLTTLQQAKEMTSGSIKGFAGSSMCKASLTAVSLLRARPCDTPLSHCVVAVLQPRGMETHTPQRTKETYSQIVLWTRPYNNTDRLLLLSMHIVCSGSFSSLRSPAEGNKEFLINSLNHLKRN